MPSERQLDELTWQAGNAAYLAAHFHRLRLLLARRVLWVRTTADDAPPEPPGWPAGAVIRDAAVDRALAGEARATEREFYRTDPAALELAAGIVNADTEAARIAAGLDATGRRPALVALCRACGLNRFERDVLVLAAAGDEHGFPRVFGYLHDDATLLHASRYLATALFCETDAEELAARACLTPTAPLTRYALLTSPPAPGTPAALRPFALDPRVDDYIRGQSYPDDRVTDVLLPVSPLPLPAAFAALADSLAARLAAGPVMPVQLIGGDAGDRLAVAAALADRLGRRAVRLDAGRVPSGSERAAFLRLLARETLLGRLLPYLEADPDEAAAVELAARLPVFLVLGGRHRAACDRQMLPVTVPHLPAPARSDLWSVALGTAAEGLNGAVEAVAAQFEFDPQRVARAVADARTAAPGDVITADDLWAACRDQTAGALAALARRIDPVYDWDDLILPASVASQLRDLAGHVALRGRVYGEWGFDAKMSRGRGISALFAGPSGTGKTMAAEVLARHLRLDLYRVDLAGVVSKYVGETERNLRTIFDTADRSGVILFFDEADALFGKRTEVKDSHDRFANIEINYLLQRMEEYRGLAILATNRKADLDRAFLRRLRFLIDFPFPDAGQRLRIWQRAFPPQTPLAGVDFAALAGMELSGGNIRNIALDAAFLAAQAGLPVGMEQLARAARRECAKVDKVYVEPGRRA